MDEDESIYDIEVQKKDTKTIPMRSRFYQAVTDSKLLEPGETDYGKLNQIFIIFIGSFDLFGRGRYKYTFSMGCEEELDLRLNDGASRLFLNTRGKDEENISPELKALLEFFENPSEEMAKKSESERIRRMQERVKFLKENEEVGARYVREWEERALEREGERAEGRAEGEMRMKKRINQLNHNLIDQGRFEDVKKAATDELYQQQLFEEFGL